MSASVSEVAAHGTSETPRDGKTEPGRGRRSGRESTEPVEEVFGVAARNAPPEVAHDNHSSVALRHGSSRDHNRSRAVLDGVGDQIGDDLLEAERVWPPTPPRVGSCPR